MDIEIPGRWRLGITVNTRVKGTFRLIHDADGTVVALVPVHADYRSYDPEIAALLIAAAPQMCRGILGAGSAFAARNGGR